MATMRQVLVAVVSKSVPLIIAAWVGAPCPPKNQNIRAFDFVLFQKVNFYSKMIAVPEEIRLHGLNWSVLSLILTTLNECVKLLALMSCIVEFMKFNKFFFFKFVFEVSKSQTFIMATYKRN